MTTYLSNAVLDDVFGSVSFLPPATFYVGLSTTVVNTTTGAGITEPTGGYARVAVANNTTNWALTATRTIKNATVIAFPMATASWGLVRSFFVADASSGGNVLLAAAVGNKTIDTGDTAAFAVNALTILIS